MTGVVLALGLVAAAPPDASSPPVRLEWRDGESRSVRLLSLDEVGIAYVELDAGDRVVPSRARWDELRGLEGATAPAGALERGTRTWRARTRLARGEHALAAPLFEALAEEAVAPATAAAFDPALRRIIAEGLLRTRIEAGDLGGAAVAALEAMRLELEGTALDEEAVAPAPRIGGLGWPSGVPLLPIEWSLPIEARTVLAARLAAFADTVVATEAALVATALLGSAAPILVGREDTLLRRALAEVSALRVSSPEDAFAGREARLAGVDPAVARWLHGQIGERLLASEDPALRRRGLLEWLCIPARFGGEVGGDLAIRRAAAILRAEGDDRLAERLEEDALRHVRVEGTLR